MSLMASQITSLGIVYFTVYSGADQRKHQCSASLAFERRIHRGPVNSTHERPVTRKMFPFDDVIMLAAWSINPFICRQLLSHKLSNKQLPLVSRGARALNAICPNIKTSSILYKRCSVLIFNMLLEIIRCESPPPIDTKY